MIKKFFQRVHRILVWIPVLWKDEDYEGTFLVKIINFKLDRLRRYFLKADIIVQSSYDKYLEEIHEALMFGRMYLCDGESGLTDEELKILHSYDSSSNQSLVFSIVDKAEKIKEDAWVSYFEKLKNAINWWD